MSEFKKAVVFCVCVLRRQSDKGIINMVKNKGLLLSSLIVGFALMGMGASVSAEVIFKENFDDQPDWTSGMNSTDTIQRASTHQPFPESWYSTYQGNAWSPSNGHPDRHEVIEILANNADKARGGTGKSFVNWRESWGSEKSQWASNGVLTKYFPEGYDELYVEFWIRFDPNWTKNIGDWKSKIFRVASWSEENSEYKAFSGGEQGPLFIWDYRSTQNYGQINQLAFRGGPHGENYTFFDSDFGDLTLNLVGLGDLPNNFTTSTRGMAEDGGTPCVPDQVNGGCISDDLNQKPTHNQIFGDESQGPQWTKMAFYVKLNSAPGVKDGVIRQWINGVQVFRSEAVNWVKTAPMVKWNIVQIGGNDYFQQYPESERHEEWYSIDDVLIANTIPDTAAVVPNAPNPPSDVIAQ